MSSVPLFQDVNKYANREYAFDCRVKKAIKNLKFESEVNRCLAVCEQDLHKKRLKYLATICEQDFTHIPIK